MKITIIRDFVLKEDVIDAKGLTIRKGTHLYVIKEPKPIKNPMTKKLEKWLVVRVDNGTGLIDLMPETAYKTEVQK